MPGGPGGSARSGGEAGCSAEHQAGYLDNREAMLLPRNRTRLGSSRALADSAEPGAEQGHSRVGGDRGAGWTVIVTRSKFVSRLSSQPPGVPGCLLTPACADPAWFPGTVQGSDRRAW